MTSRPSTEVLELDRKHPFNRRIEVVGFRRQDLSKYVRKLLSEDDAADVMAQVDAHPQLAAFMQTPINCAQACLMYRSGLTKLPTTIPAIASHTLRSVFKLSEGKQGQTSRFHRTLGDCPGSSQGSCNGLGKFCIQDAGRPARCLPL